MISVIMSIYNEPEKWICQSIDSILHQTYSNIELIIVVDNPQIDDGTRSILEKYKEDERVVISYNKENIGLALSMNKAITLAKGEFIGRMDADDISEVDRLKCELQYINEQSADMVCTNAIYIDENGNECGRGLPLPSDINSSLYFSNRVIHPSILIRSEVIRKIHGYRNFRRTQDYDLWLRLLSENCKMCGLDKYLVKYRRSTQQASNSHRLEQYYTVKYQRQLYHERRKNGTDSFSEESYKSYLQKKNINEEKNKKCIKALDYLRRLSLEKNYIYRVRLFMGALFSYPEIALDAIILHLKQKNMKE